MFVRKGLFGGLGMLMLLASAQLPTHAQATVQDLTTAQNAVEDTQTIEDIQVTADTRTIEAIQVAGDTQIAGETEVLEDIQSEAVSLQLAPVQTAPAATEAAALTYLAEESSEAEESLEIAQFSRQRTRGAATNSSFIGVGLDIGYVDDISFAVISKIAFADRIAVRPSVVIGDDVAVLVPVTYDFRQYAPEAGGFQFIPYGGIGAAYNSNEDSDFNLLLSAGVDVPVSRQITVNAQANLGVFNDTDFGVTVGAAYNIGNLF